MACRVDTWKRDPFLLGLPSPLEMELQLLNFSGVFFNVFHASSSRKTKTKKAHVPCKAIVFGLMTIPNFSGV